MRSVKEVTQQSTAMQLKKHIKDSVRESEGAKGRTRIAKEGELEVRITN
jgi:hypothetical protein